MDAPCLTVRIGTISPRSWWELRFFGLPFPPVVCLRRHGDQIGRNIRQATPEEIRAANERLLQTTRRKVI